MKTTGWVWANKLAGGCSSAWHERRLNGFQLRLCSPLISWSARLTPHLTPQTHMYTRTHTHRPDPPPPPPAPLWGRSCRPPPQEPQTRPTRFGWCRRSARCSTPGSSCACRTASRRRSASRGLAREGRGGRGEGCWAAVLAGRAATPRTRIYAATAASCSAAPAGAAYRQPVGISTVRQQARKGSRRGGKEVRQREQERNAHLVDLRRLRPMWQRDQYVHILQGRAAHGWQSARSLAASQPASPPAQTSFNRLLAASYSASGGPAVPRCSARASETTAAHGTSPSGGARFATRTHLQAKAAVSPPHPPPHQPFTHPTPTPHPPHKTTSHTRAPAGRRWRWTRTRCSRSSPRPTRRASS